MPRVWTAMTMLGVIALAGCGGEYAQSKPSEVPSAPETGGATAAVQAEAPAPGDSDARFSQEVPAEPPPRPVREIDRAGGEEGKRGEGVAVAEARKSRQLDTTMGGGGGGGGGESGTETNRTTAEAPHDASMLVYTAHLTMAVYQVAPAIDAIEVIGRSFGGYLSSRSDVQIVIRVPRAHFDEALHKIEATGDVLHRQVSAEDVTDQYVDLDARLRNARAVRDRLEALLQKAAVKEAIEIQRELERVTGEIETIEGKLKLLKDRVAYSVIGVTFEARGDAAVRDKPMRLPFPWLGQLGLPHLLNLGSQ